MQRVDRPAVEATIGRVAVDLHEALSAIVAKLAQALQLPEEELIRVSTMRLDMVRDRRWHHLAATEAEPAKRMVTQLMLAQALPVRRTVQMLPSGGHYADLIR
jgi:hypothetical protein